MTNFLPNEDRIFVELIDSPDKTKGGLYIPETAKAPPSLGIILAIGEGKRSPTTGELIPIDGLKKGDLVLFNPAAGVDWADGDKIFKTIRATDIIQYDPDYSHEQTK